MGCQIDGCQDVEANCNCDMMLFRRDNLQESERYEFTTHPRYRHLPFPAHRSV